MAPRDHPLRGPRPRAGCPTREALELQRALREERIAGRIDQDVLLLLEHEPAVTLGRGTTASSLPLPPEELARRGLTVDEVERGGDVTWHGPGQLVGYPILDLKQHRQDLHWYLRQLEEALDRRPRPASGSGRAEPRAHRRVDRRAEDRQHRDPREAG